MNVDEGWSYYLCRNDISIIISNLVKDRHPPIAYLLLHAWLALGNHHEMWLRLPWLLLACFAVAAAYLVGQELFDRDIALGCSFIYAVSYLAWEYDTWMRMYVLLSFLSLTSTYFFTRLGRTGDRAEAAGYVVTSILLLYSHYFGILTLAVHVGTSLIQRRQSWKPLITCWLLIGAAFVPWLPMLSRQIAHHAAQEAPSSGSPALAAVVALHTLPMLAGLDTVPFLVRGLPGMAWTCLCAVALAVLVVVGLHRLRGRDGRCLLMLMLVPYAMYLGLIALRFPELMRPRYYVAAIPWLGMAAAAALSGTSHACRLARWCAAALLLLVNIAVLCSYSQSAFFRAADWKTPSEWIAARAQRGDVIMVYDNHALAAFNYYYAGDTVSYQALDVFAPQDIYSPAYWSGGRLRQIRLWDKPEPASIESDVSSVQRGFLILYHEMRPDIRSWFSQHFGYRDSLEISNAWPDGRAEVFWLERAGASGASR
jgi:uncharacterized membrane protein